MARAACSIGQDWYKYRTFRGTQAYLTPESLFISNFGDASIVYVSSEFIIPLALQGGWDIR